MMHCGNRYEQVWSRILLQRSRFTRWIYYMAFNNARGVLPTPRDIHVAGYLLRDIPIPAKIYTTFVQCWTKVEDVGSTLYKCYTIICVCWDSGIYATLRY